MGQSIMKIVVIATVEMTPEQFLEDYNTILIERMDLSLQALGDNYITLNADDFEITRIEEL